MKRIALLGLLAVFVACLGVNFSQHEELSVGSNPFIFEGVSKDGWSDKSFRVDLQSILNDMGSSLDVGLELSGWRPDGSKVPEASVSLCGQKTSRIIQNDNEEFSFSISKRDCTAPTIEVDLSNTFPSSDGRRLGLKVKNVSVHSHIGLEILSNSLVWVCAACLMVLFLLLEKHWQIVGSAIISVWLISLLHWDSSFELFILSLCLISFLIGFKKLFLTSLETEENPTSTRVYITFTSVLLLIALLVRMYGIDFGLPHYFHPDEYRKGRIAQKISETLNFDPNYFLHPSLLLYSTSALGTVKTKILGDESSVSTFTLAGREVSAIAGVGAVLLTIIIGGIIGGARVGMLSGALVAFSPLMITCSRYLKEDSLLSFWILAACLSSLWGAKNNKPGFLILSGLLAGLAASSKYSGVLTIIPVLFFPIAYKRFSRNWVVSALIAGLLVPVGFVLATPYSILNFDKFLEDFNAERKHMVIGHHATIISSWDHFWSYHLARSILPALGIIPVLIGMMFSGLVVKNKNFPLLAILGAAILFYAPAEYVNAKPPPQPERYIFPAIPFIAILASYGLSIINNLLLRRVLITCSILGILIPSLLLAREVPNDTRNIMRDWMLQNIPAESKIMIDAIPYTPAFPENQFEIMRLANPEERRGMTIDSLKEQGVQYVLVTSLSYERYFHTRTSDQIIRRRFEELFSKGEIIFEVVPKYKTYGFHNPTLRLIKIS